MGAAPGAMGVPMCNRDADGARGVEAASAIGAAAAVASCSGGGTSGIGAGGAAAALPSPGCASDVAAASSAPSAGV